jgi:hypothetical protein
MNLQKIVSSKEVAFGMNFRHVECETIEDFLQNAETGQKFWDNENELMYYKIMIEDDVIVFNLISGKAIQVN